MRKKITQTKISLPDFSKSEYWSGSEYHAYIRQARNYYYENYKDVDLIKYIWTWMDQQGYTDHQIGNAKKCGNSNLLGVVAGINCKLLLDGMPDFHEKHAEYWQTLTGTTSELKPVSHTLFAMIEKAIVCGARIAHEKETFSKKSTAQDRTLCQAKDAAIAIDEWLQSYKDSDWDIDNFNFKSHFTKFKLETPHLRMIKSFYQSEFDRFDKLVNAKPTDSMTADEADELSQLKESYENLSTAQIKKFHKALLRILTETEEFHKLNTKVSKQTKLKQIEKAVAKLKYLPNDAKYGLTSVKPSAILGAKTLWVYNTKTRKIGCYVAEDRDPDGFTQDGLGLKGSSVIGFNNADSLQKTVRNHNDVLPKISDCSSSQLKSLFDSIPTLDTRMNGKIDEHTLLLKVDKGA